MKHMRKILSLLLALVMVLGLATVAMAQTEAYDDDDKTTDGKITIKNAAKGETYTLVKLFDATVSADGKIAYTGEIPTDLSGIFEKKNNENITAVADHDPLTEDDIIALTTWANTQAATIEAESDGSVLEFTNLPYGYYVILSTQGSAVTINSTNPQAEVIDKNTGVVSAKKFANDETKDDNNVNIGDTVTYTLEFETVNFLEDENDKTDARFKKVVNYEIKDTLPDWLSSPTVTGIKVVDPKGAETALSVQQFDTTKKNIVIPWINETTKDSLYANGSKIVITYTATVNGQATIGADGNTNEVTITPYVDNGGNDPEPWSESWDDDETIKTFGVAMRKVDENGDGLAGATFTAAGLNVEPVDGQPGVYKVTSVDSSATSAVMSTDDEGYLVILGLKNDATVSVTESQAPDGYVLQKTPFVLRPVCMTETIATTEVTVWYDADGNVVDTADDGVKSEEVTHYTVDKLKEAAAAEQGGYRFVNVPGRELPETGGMGTTIFYVVGAILVLGAGVLLVTKRRMGSER